MKKLALPLFFITSNCLIAAATGPLYHGSFQDDGSGRTSIPAAQLSGTIAASNLPSSVLTNGSTNVTLSGNATNYYFVSSWGNDANAGISSLSPLATLTNALTLGSNATAGGTAGFVTIHVSTGTFNVPTNTLIYSNVTIIGDSKYLTILNEILPPVVYYDATNTPYQNGYGGIIVAGNNVTLQSLTVQPSISNGGYQTAVVVNKFGSNFYAKDCSFLGDADIFYSSLNGFSQNAPVTGMCDDCDFRSGWDWQVLGILGQVTYWTNVNCRFKCNADTNFNTNNQVLPISGVLMQWITGYMENNDFSVSGNTWLDGGSGGTDAAIYFSGTSTLTVKNNTFDFSDIGPIIRPINNAAAATGSALYVVGDFNATNNQTGPSKVKTYYDSVSFANVFVTNAPSVVIPLVGSNMYFTNGILMSVH